MSKTISLPSSGEDLDHMIEDLKNISTNQSNENYMNFTEEDDFDSSPSKLFGEEKKHEKLIFMNCVSCIADGSQSFVLHKNFSATF